MVRLSYRNNRFKVTSYEDDVSLYLFISTIFFATYLHTVYVKDLEESVR
jgi:hypothetical protein